MIGDINLIPQSEVVEQKKTKAVKTSTIVSLVLLFILILIGAYLVVITTGIKKQISEADTTITFLRNSINELSAVEISARNLDKKYKVLNTLFTQRSKYSALLEEINIRKPPEISINSLDVKTETINVTGSADSYIAIAGFINNLLNKTFEGGNSKLKEVFTSVTLNSVSLDKATNEASFFIVINYSESLIKQ
jgi:Tfp pilus assembly protein PilN